MPPVSTFGQQLEEFEKKANRTMAKIVYTVIIECTYNLLELSPWGDWPEWGQWAKAHRPMPPYQPGRFKGSWDYSAGQEPTFTYDTVDPSGAVSQIRIRNSMGLWSVRSAGDKHYIANLTPYGQILEEGRTLVGHNLGLGHMIEATAQAFPAIVRRAVQRNMQP